MSGVVAFEGDLNSIVKEYLEFNTLQRTVDIFEKECVEKDKPIEPGEVKPKANQKLLAVQNEMLQCFQTGQRERFLHLWKENIPEGIRSQDSVSQKLEFYLHIYFAIYPLKHKTEGAEEGMNCFKVYLETQGAALSQTTEFLPFYALPFVPNPRAHPSYKELFSDKWVPDLQLRLEKFLVLALQSTPQPRLFELYNGGGGRAASDTMELKLIAAERKAITYLKRFNRVQTDYHNLIGITADLVDSLENVVQGHPAMEQKSLEADRKSQAYLKRYNRVQNDYHNLIGITADLVDSLENTIQGNAMSPEYLQQICLRLFSNQVRQSVDFTRPGTAGEVLRQSVAPPQGLNKRQTTPGKSMDYDKIRHDLTHAGDRSKGLLLQALRWKLTKSSPPERDAFLSAYVQHDLLGCQHASSHRHDVLGLLTADSELVKQYTARLFNAFASLSDGRSYLAANPDLLHGLMTNLHADTRDSLTRENVLGCLQKLSLRRQLQSLMIQEGIIDWLVSVLDDNDALSDYTLEYSVALLMNLCLRTTGKKMCAKSAHRILKVLSDLLGHDNQEIIPYVNGTLYSILAIPSIREEAKAMGMEEILQCFVKEGQPDMNRQIEFIIKQLNSTEEPDDSESDDEEEEEDEEEQDAMEQDLDKQELLKVQPGELSGDRLLNTHYVNSAAANGAARKKRPTDGVLLQEDVLRRPVTPGHFKGAGDNNAVVHVQPKTSRPPTGRPHSSQSQRGASRDMHRPPTRSGSRDRPRTQGSTIDTDAHGSEYQGHRSTSSSSKRSSAARKDPVGQPKPSQKALDKMTGNGMAVAGEEYSAAFGTRARIPRTPDVRPTSRGSVGGGPMPRPEYSDSLPTSRPNSGGRPSSSGGSKQTSPSPRTPRTPKGRSGAQR